MSTSVTSESGPPDRADAAPVSGAKAGYLEVLRKNANFRRLWLGNIVSLLGDWFNFIALLNITVEFGGTPLAIGLVFIAKLLPSAIASPLAGLLVDRFDRRRLMMVCDALRAVIVLGLLLVDSTSDLYLIYVLTTLQVAVSAAFQPAQSAVIPNITTPRELLTANTLMAASWSAMLALGAALGGFATGLVGAEWVFVIDSATYLVSGYFIFRTVIPQNTIRPSAPIVRTALKDIAAGWQRMRVQPQVGRIALAKASWAIGGGGLVFMLALVGQTMLEGAPDVGVGILYAARGIGTGIGPVVARRYFHDARRWPVLLGAFVAVSGLCYMVFAFVAAPILLVALVVFAHASSGANWVLATVLLQERTIDAFRGRVFATEWLLLMAADTVSILVASLFLQWTSLSLSFAIVLFAFLQVAFGLAWMRWIRRYES